MHLFGMQLTRRQIESSIGKHDQIGGILPFELTEGRARGVRALRFTTGSGLTFTSLADRALDLAHAEYCGVPLCWRSPNGDAAPSYYDPDDDRWLRMFFGGLMTTCGLTNFGPAGHDRYGSFGLHGRVDCLPAESVSYTQEWEEMSASSKHEGRSVKPVFSAKTCNYSDEFRPASGPRRFASRTP